MTKLSSIFLLILCSSEAIAQPNVILYTCSEQKSAGWEKQGNGNFYIGKFNTETKTFFVRYHPSDTSQYALTESLTVASIEIPSPDGGTRILRSDICNRTFQFGAEIDMRSKLVDGGKNCKLTIDDRSKHPNREESFDSGYIWFSQQLSARPSFVTYTESIIIPGSNSYLSEGTCGLAN